MNSKEPLLTLADVGKKYLSFRGVLQRSLHTISLGRFGTPSEIWVLQDVSFVVNRGEAIGIIGHNGAGKSTLLKLISGVTTPSAGRIQRIGRISAILELGLGLHPDLSGRANIRLAGQLQGFTAEEMSETIDAVIAFAEIGPAIDQPVRIYSSGMVARLAFAIATAKRPDILIVDEVLSVGDSYFQHKSFARIRQFQREGATILFVSHDITAMRTICDRVLLLFGGRLIHEGEPKDVLDRYNAMVLELDKAAGLIETARAQERIERTADVPAGSGARFVSAVMRDQHNAPIAKVEIGAQCVVHFEICVDEAIDDLVIGFIIRDRLGNDVYGTNTLNLRERAGNLQPGVHVDASFHMPINLGPGSYSISGALARARDGAIVDYTAWVDRLVVFDVVNTTQPPFTGLVSLPLSATVTRRPDEGDMNMFGRSVYSQFGEDGILEEIFRRLGVKQGVCVEFGGYDGVTFSNTAYLIRNLGWRGFFIEIDEEMSRLIRKNYESYPVTVVKDEVLPSNIEAHLESFSVSHDFDLLSIDVDGNDYWIWQAITKYRPKIIIIECNGAYLPHEEWIMPFDVEHRWRADAHYGASPAALAKLAKEKGYNFVCCEEQGANMIFVAQEWSGTLPIQEFSGATWRPPRYGNPATAWTHPRRLA